MYVVIAGGGKVGEYLATVLLNSGNEVAIIESNRQQADRLSVILQGRYLVICGDCCDSKFQEDSGTRRADVFVAATGQDDTNLVCCEIAQRVFAVPRTVARVNNPKNLRIFREVGIETISSTQMIANLIEEETLMGSVSAVTSLASGNVQMREIIVPRMHAHSNEQGVRVGDIDMPDDSMIVAISSKNDVNVAHEDSLLFPGFKAIVVADTDVYDDVRAVFKAL